MFMVGVALPFSLASRRARGQSFGRMFAHAVIRALLLIALGIFLRSQGRAQTYFTFEDVLTQIGLGYVFLFLLAWARPRVQLGRGAAILVGYWAAFALVPAAPAGLRLPRRSACPPTGRTSRRASRATGTRTPTSRTRSTAGS